MNLERTNLGDAALLALDPVPTLGSVDLSYLSLVKAVPQFRAIMRNQGELLCLVKPLFETEDTTARRTGTMDVSTYAPLLHHLIATLSAQEHTAVLHVTHSPVTGNNGTHEFFLHVVFGDAATPELSGEIDAAVERVLALPKYQK